MASYMIMQLSDGRAGECTDSGIDAPRWAGWLLAIVLAAGLLVAPAVGAESATAPFPSRWIDGTSEEEPHSQVQRYDADTYVLRQSIRTNFEGPFLYLLFGNDRALLLDSGAGGIKIRPLVDAVIARWLKAKKRASIPLIVAHSHGHGDHIAGDEEFLARPDTVVVGTSPQAVAAFFDIESWPQGIAAFDLGKRVLDIIPTPGHQPAHIMIFDRRTRVLLSGDALYPGRLYFARDRLEEYRGSIDRVVDFTRSRNVTWVLGAHIEMTSTPKRDYKMGAESHPNERALELPYSRLIELQQALHQMAEKPQREAHDDFIIYPR